MSAVVAAHPSAQPVRAATAAATFTIRARANPIDFSPSVSRRQLERAIHDATNHARRSHGRDALDADPHLATIARSHSTHMVDADFTGHETPGGRTLPDQYDRAGYDWRQCGENVAKHYPNDLDDATAISQTFVDSWLDSPGHRENVFDADWRVKSIDVDYAADGAVLAT